MQNDKQKAIFREWGTAAKIRFDDFQTISRPYLSLVVSEMFWELASTENTIV